jgi:tetratricopeptide (TPR) repeat protein
MSAPRVVLRLGILALLGLEAWRVVSVTRFEAAMDVARATDDAAQGVEALAAVETARAIRSGGQEIWVWLADAAGFVYEDEPRGGWPAPEARRLLDLAWAGYAGAVLRCPVDAWSWSGLAQTALRQARERDRGRTLSFDELERRAEGTLDGGYAVALAAARLAVELQPSGYQQLDVLGRVYEGIGDVDRAVASYVRSARMMPAPSFHFWGNGRRLVRDLYVAVLGGLEAGLAAAPEFERCMLHLEVGRFARTQSDPVTALRHLGVARASAPNAYWTYQSAWELATVHEEQGRNPEALAEFDAVIASGFAVGEANRRSAAILARLQRFDAACGRYREAVRGLGPDAGLRAEASRACEAAGDLESAERFLLDGVVHPVDDLALARALLEFYRRVGRDRSAASLAATWARDYPDHPELAKWAEEGAGGGL